VESRPSKIQRGEGEWYSKKMGEIRSWGNSEEGINTEQCKASLVLALLKVNNDSRCKGRSHSQWNEGMRKEQGKWGGDREKAEWKGGGQQ